MALGAIQSVMHLEENKSLHPFFSKAPKDQAPIHETPCDDLNDDDYEQPPTSAQPPKERKKRTRKNDGVNEKKNGTSHTRNQASLDRFTLRTKAQGASGATDHGHVSEEPSHDDDTNPDGRKRRKTESPNPSIAPTAPVQSLPVNADWQEQPQAEAATTYPKDVDQPLNVTLHDDTAMANSTDVQPPSVAQDLPRPSTPQASTQTVIDANNTDTSLDTVENQPRKVTPKKQIKVSKNGKLLSSPPKPITKPSSPPRKRRGRPPKVKISPTVTIIRYGSDATSRLVIGQKIEDVLNSKPSSKRRQPKKVPSKPADPPKVTHPFFLDKSAQTKDDPAAKSAPKQPPPTPRKSACTPGKLRAETRRGQSPEPMPTFGVSALGSRVAKQSGLNEASWPTRETAHVRNSDGAGSYQYAKHETITHLPIRPRKMKSTVASFPKEEGLIAKLSQELSRDIHKKHDPLRSNFEPPADVRLPGRLLVTGSELQRRVRNQVRTRLPVAGAQDVNMGYAHPAITTLFSEIEHTLTPFDDGICEGQVWTQKYSPKCASHVLGSNNEASVLKDWLQSLTVMAVGGAQDPSKAGTTLEAKKPPRKKRRKIEDDFIVGDDFEENEEMVEITNVNEAGVHRSISYRRPFWTRNKNVVLISGPHGCGKSATVYAVAKELGFEVFEMNSGSRRSGKDIQDKVGDMTANHLVNHQRGGASAREELVPADDTDNERMSTALQKDLDSGRQGTMMSFFKSGPTTQAKPKIKPKAPEPKKAPTSAIQAMLPIAGPQRKSQKQSLILFEEADILFEEDQHFWSQVIKLASQSKRPIVITCNDERQIPVQDLPLAAILRLQPPQVDLATDYLLVLAGREGHILERQAISDLLYSKNQDLRASIAELNLWCQMSVGDRKGGLEWMYQRWPPGRDVDEHGRLLRVASEGTYQSGMGWLSHNIFESHNNTGFDKQDELLQDAWRDWGINPTEWSNNTSSPLTQNSQLKELERLEALTDSLSAADIYCRVDLPSYTSSHDQPTDPTLPPMPTKERQSYTLAASPLQTDPKTDFLNLDTSLYTSTYLQTQRAFPPAPAPQPTHTQSILTHRFNQQINRPLTRPAFACLDVLAAPADPTPSSSSSLTLSSFDRAFRVITLDLAPYIRSIVAHEMLRDAERVRLSNLLSEGGRAKRPRTTRASRVAMEGGVREMVRRERWFDGALGVVEVMRTGGMWAGLGWRGEGDGGAASVSVTGTAESGGEEMDVDVDVDAVGEEE
ncbi:P-loop containing nucleoside triphosphate hydrolase protein [Dothidotthia symphoricarpi CBS 119687]|uniref:P-loop containing nucleoside triphosphate hydrolase protein n=1 Tax=Dothidotthia symphoricarpi CBS 119687 TaxID=1392245 RepID=A0A6A6A3I4_9PLEO|nr:P-loop containing nucleoside triphosphate hydrolase protein [Dothidotthia symphoricarpi CBS 119687]KAF2126439.1 P-loop containing nucleoside triphosphate hydrolase protein [Dothidotthia symphoricarpi CBS 119687]